MKNDEALALLASAGDRLTRDTAHLMDLCVAGTIDALVGHGTVTIKPARLEEIIERIAPREQDKDGNWIVTLLRDNGVEGKYREAQADETLRSVAMQSSGRYNALLNVQQFLEDDDLDGAKEFLGEVLGEHGEAGVVVRNEAQTSDEIASLAGKVMNISVDEIGATGITVSMLLKYAKRLAGSALSQTNVDN